MDIGAVKVLISESDLSKWFSKALEKVKMLKGLPQWLSFDVEPYKVVQQQDVFCLTGSVKLFAIETPISITLNPMVFGSEKPHTIGFRVVQVTMFGQGNSDTTLIASKFISQFAQAKLSQMNIECADGVLWVNLLHVFLRMGVMLSGHVVDLQMTPKGLSVEIGG